MDVIRFPADPCPRHWRSPVLALGNFDGLHRGHIKIIDRVHRSAVERGATAVALTFDPHPTQVTRPDKAPPLLMTAAQKLEAFDQAGMHGAAVVSFTPEFSRWEPEAFVRRVLVDWLHVSEVWVGANFLFGHERAGNFSVLRDLGGRFGFRAEKIDPVRYKDFVVSSTRIRRLVSEGRVDEAAALLGRHHFVDGEVVRGDGRGRTLGFPTANLVTENRVLPPNGVYASIVRVGRTCWPSVTNIGTRPTFGPDGQPSIEAHLLAGGRDLYGESLRLYFVQRLRDERRFESVEALTRQIAEDCRLVQALVGQIAI